MQNGTVSFRFKGAPHHVRTPSPDPRRWWTLGVLCLSLLVISLDNTILNVALPTLERDLGASASQLQWIVDSYMLVFAGLLLTAGALGDRFGRRRALTFGLVVFGAGSALSAIATTPEMLIATRARSWASAARSSCRRPSRSSPTSSRPPSAPRRSASGPRSPASASRSARSPAAGSSSTPTGAGSSSSTCRSSSPRCSLGRGLVPESQRPRRAARSTCRGFALSTAGLTALVWAIIEAPGRGWTDPVVLGGFGRRRPGARPRSSRWELRSRAPDARRPAVPQPRASRRRAGRSRWRSSPSSGRSSSSRSTCSSMLGYSAFEAGLRMLPVAGGLIVGGPLSAKLAERLGTKVVVAAGLLIVGTGLALLALRGRRAAATASSPPRWPCSASAWAWRWRRPPTR